MKPITILPIERETLSAILITSKNLLSEWANKCEDKTAKEYWLKHIREINKINHYMTEHYQQTYYLYEDIFRFQ